MARPERNNVDYFPHEVSHGKKMSYIEKKYKNDGYATWFKILEELGNTSFHFLNLSDDVQLMFLSDRCNISEDLLLDIINDLAKMGEFDSDLWENKIIYCQKFIDSIDDAYKKRNNKCITLEGLGSHLISLGILKPSKSKSTVPVKPQSKVDKNKVDKTKENKNIPALDEFKKYALENKPDINVQALELKYKSWVENGWKTGNNKKISNWKSTLLNTLQYINSNNQKNADTGRIHAGGADFKFD